MSELPEQLKQENHVTLNEGDVVRARRYGCKTFHAYVVSSVADSPVMVGELGFVGVHTEDAGYLLLAHDGMTVIAPELAGMFLDDDQE